MKTLIFDIETIPDQNLPAEMMPEFDKGRLVDPAKIEAAKKEFEEGLIKKLSCNPMTLQIVSIQMSNGFEFYTDNDGTESGMLKDFWYQAENTDLFVGHNILGFDLPAILIRSMILGITPTRKFNLKKYQVRPIYDTMFILGNWKDWVSLDVACTRFGIPTKTGHGSQVYEMWKAGKSDEIHQYCQDDVDITRRLYNKMKLFY